MSKTVQWKRGNTTVSSAYIGAVGEITINTDTWNIYAHDGILPGGHLTGNVVANLSYYNNDVGFITLAEVPTQISYFNNDVGYTVVGANVSDFVNDANYVSVGANISAFNNNVGYITQANVPTNVSAFANDANYVSSGSNISVFNNDAQYVSVGYNPFNQVLNTNSSVTFANVTITGNITSPSGNIGIGNLYVIDQTIYGSRANANIVLIPNGTGTVFVPSLTLPVGSLVQEVQAISVIIADLTLDTVTSYSANTTLAAGTIGNPDGIAPPWAIYRFTTTPNPVLQVDDVIGGTAVPVNSVITYVGTDAYSAYIVTDKVFPLGVPADGTIITVDRPVVNASLTMSTGPNVDISFNTTGLGVIVPHSNIIPISNNIYSLGSPTKRFQQLWLGGGTIFIADPVTGVDISLAAYNGNLEVQGGKGISAGEFTLFENRIVLNDPTKEIFIGEIGATAPVTFRRTVQVRNSTDEWNLFKVEDVGTVDILSNISTDPTKSAFNIVSARTRDIISPDNLGVAMHLTGSSTSPSRIYHDSFGANNYSAFIGRHARGNVAAPTQTLNNDIISRIGANPYDTSGFAPISTSRIDFVNSEDQTPTARGSRIESWTTTIGTNTIARRLVVDEFGISLQSGANTGVKFGDSTRQTTAFGNTSAVTKLVAGSGLTANNTVGIVGIDATGVLNVAGTNNQINVVDSGSKNLTLSLPQSISSNSTVTFANLTITGNLTVAGNITTAGSSSIESKILYLANTSTSASQIDGGGIILGNVSDPYAVSILYNLGEDFWDTDGAGLKTLEFLATNATMENLTVNGTAHFGASYIGYDFPNAEIQVDCDVNGYNQIVGKNHNSGTNASMDYIAVNDIGNDSANFIDMGINSSNYANPEYSSTGPNDGYVFVNGGNLALGTQTPNTSIVFHAGGTQSNNVIGTANSTGFYLGNVTVTNLFATTTNITEGTQVYFTNARARTAISVAGNLSYSNVTGVISYTTPANISYFVNDVPYATVSQMAANVAGANAAIITANTNMKSYVDSAITTVNGNIVTANNNVVAYVNSLNTTMAANVAGANLAIITANNAMKVYVDNQTYTNVNVSNYLSNYTGNISTTGNITGNYFFGNGAFLTGIAVSSTYGNANVAAYLPVYSGNIGAGNINASGNITGSYFFGNIALATGISTYGNANVAAYLPTDSTIIAINGNVAGANAAIVTANNGMRVYVDNKIFAVNSNLTTANSNMKSYVDNQTYTNVNVANYLNSYSGNINSTGNITGNYFFGNGSTLTGVGTVTSVRGNGTVSGLTLTGNVTTTGNITLGGSLSNITNSQLANSTISGVSLGSNLANLTAGTGISFSSGSTYNGSTALTVTNSDLGSSQAIFKNIAVAGQTTVTANLNNDTATFVAGTGVNISTSGKSITFTNTSSVEPRIAYTIPNTFSIGLTKNTQYSIFGRTNGVTLASDTVYQYEATFNINRSTTADFLYNLKLGAGVALSQHNYTVQCNDTTTSIALVAGITMMSNNVTSNFNTPVVVANMAAAYAHFIIWGTIDVTTGGNVDFMCQLSATQSTFNNLSGGYIKLLNLGPTGTLGTWS